MIYNRPTSEFLKDEEEIPVDLDNNETKEDRNKKYRHDRKSDTHPVNGIWPWDRIKKLLQRFVGKPFDDAFSYYCKQVPKYQQHIFIDYFKPPHYTWQDSFYVDDDGLIQKLTGRKHEPKRVVYHSDDFKTELRHKKTGKKKPDIMFRHYPFTANNYKEKYPRAKSYYEAATTYENEFESVIIQGWAKEFDSKKDPEYKRLMTEQRKRREIARKEEQKKIKSKAYSFVHTTPEEKVKEQYENTLKIERKGFDPNTSFHKNPKK